MLPTDSLRRSSATLLWAATAPHADLDAVKQAYDQGFDQAAFVRGAQIGRVAGLVLANLAAADRSVADEAWAAPLVGEAGVRRSQEALLLPRVLRSGVAPLVEDGLEPMVLKGPALLDRYPAPGLRGMDDIDVLVATADRDRAVRVLETAGWRAVRHDRETGYDLPFVHEGLPGLPIELHFGLDRWWERNSRLRVDVLRQRRLPAEIRGVHAWRLPPEEELIYLAAHAAKPWHIFSRLIWVADLAVVSESGVDWARVERLADDLACRMPVAVGLTLAARLGARPPARLLHLPWRIVRSGALDDLLDPSWPLAPDPDRRQRIASALMDRRIDQARLALGWVGTPNNQGRRIEAAAEMARGSLRWVWRTR